MDIVLVPGFWLDASSWEDVTPTLLSAGHKVHPLTLPGKESVEAARGGISLQDHVDAVVDVIDSIAGPVVLVGHSGGGAIIHGAVDARPDRVVRAVYVDSGPVADGEGIGAQYAAERDDVPLPPWDAFQDADLADLSEARKADFRARAVPEPRGVAHGVLNLADERRFEVPATVVLCEFPSDMFRQLLGSGHPHLAELRRIRDVELVDLPTGHWPQFTRPADLATAILAAVQQAERGL